jgi:hypothetical protein
MRRPVGGSRESIVYGVAVSDARRLTGWLRKLALRAGEPFLAAARRDARTAMEEGLAAARLDAGSAIEAGLAVTQAELAEFQAELASLRALVGGHQTWLQSASDRVN